MNDTKRIWYISGFILFSILFISAVVYGIFLYVDLVEQRTKAHERTERALLEQTALEQVEKIENFHGDEPYHIVYGRNEQGTEQLIFYPLEGTEKTLTIVDMDEILPESAMIGMWQTECDGCEFVKITPALLDDKILWELVYYDAENRYVLDYRSIYDGTPYEQISFASRFK